MRVRAVCVCAYICICVCVYVCIYIYIYNKYVIFLDKYDLSCISCCVGPRVLKMLNYIVGCDVVISMR